MTDVPALNRRMTSLDASFLYLEQPNALLHVAGIYSFARPLDYDRLVAYVAERLPLIPRYTQRAVMVPLNLGHPTWEPAPDFDIREHILHHRLHGNDDAALAALCATLFAEPLDRSRPLWEMHLIDGYGTGCAMLAKTHHCMIDGASGVELINLLMDPTPKPRALEPITQSLPRGHAPLNPMLRAAAGLLDTVSTQVRIGEQVVRALLRPSHAMQEARGTLDALSTLARTLLSPPPATPFNGAISTERALAWAPLSLNEVKAVKNRLGGTVNDVVLAVIAGSLRYYLRERGVKTERTELKAMVPVNVRTEHEHLKLGNRVSMMVAPLPIGITDPVERLRQVSAAMDLLKSSGQASQMERIVALTDLLPPPLQRPLAQLQASVYPVNTVCTNVPGPRETRYLLGEPVQLMVPLVPLAAGIGLGFAIMSYADQLTIGINGDAGRVPDVWKLAAAVRRAFEELWEATGLERVVAPPAKPKRPTQRPTAAVRARRARKPQASERPPDDAAVASERVRA
jgi:WS/DGAT/MGAT family acyltransferase